MSLVTRVTDASIDASTAMFASQITGLLAGEDLDVAAPCYIKTSDGLVYMTNATADNEAAEVAGFTPRAVKSGQAVTLFGPGARFRYGSSLTPGNILYAGATAGRLDTAPTVGDGVGVATVIDAQDIIVTRGLGQEGRPNASLFVSAEQTGSGSSQDVAHGLGVIPTKVLIAVTEVPDAAAETGFDVAEGSHDATNVKVTVTNTVKYKVLAAA